MLFNILRLIAIMDNTENVSERESLDYQHGSSLDTSHYESLDDILIDYLTTIIT